MEIDGQGSFKFAIGDNEVATSLCLSCAPIRKPRFHVQTSGPFLARMNENQSSIKTCLYSVETIKRKRKS